MSQNSTRLIGRRVAATLAAGMVAAGSVTVGVPVAEAAISEDVEYVLKWKKVGEVTVRSQDGFPAGQEGAPLPPADYPMVEEGSSFTFTNPTSASPTATRPTGRVTVPGTKSTITLGGSEWSIENLDNGETLYVKDSQSQKDIENGGLDRDTRRGHFEVVVEKFSVQGETREEVDAKIAEIKKGIRSFALTEAVAPAGFDGLKAPVRIDFNNSTTLQLADIVNTPMTEPPEPSTVTETTRVTVTETPTPVTKNVTTTATPPTVTKNVTTTQTHPPVTVTTTPPAVTTTLPPQTVTTTEKQPPVTVTETPSPKTETETVTPPTTTVTEKQPPVTVTETPEKVTETLTPDPVTETVTKTPEKVTETKELPPVTVTETPATKTVTETPETVTKTPEKVTETITQPPETVTEHVPTTVVRKETEKVKLPPETVTVTPKKETETVTAPPATVTKTETVPGKNTTVTQPPVTVTDRVEVPGKSTTVVKTVPQQPATVTETVPGKPGEPTTVRVVETVTVTPEPSEPMSNPNPGPAFGSVTGTVVWDNDGSRTVNEGDKPVPGQVVVLKRDGKEVTRTLTDGNGFYEFPGLEPGKYTIEVIGPDGATKVFEDREATVKPGETDSGNDWGYKVPPAPGTQLGSFSGTVVWDEDRSKHVNDGDERIPGLTVVALKDGKEIARTTTDENGFYKFDNLEPGEYGIAVYGPDGGELFFDDKAATVVAGEEDTGNDWGFVREDAPALVEEGKPATPVETVRMTLATTGANSYALAGLGVVLAALVALAVVGRRKVARQ